MGIHSTSVVAGQSRISDANIAEDFYRMNFQSLFAGRVSSDGIAEFARAAVRNRKAARDGFETRLQTMFASPTSHPQPVMSGWPLQRIRGLCDRHGGLLLALFHYGAHRHVILDLAISGVPIVAPVAGGVYDQYTRAGVEAFPDIAGRLDLLEVDNPRVGRDLVRLLRRGRVGAIYVDGNMGPDGHQVQEGAVPIRFMGRRIRAKAGIARLARTFKLPVVPVFAVPDPDGGCHRPLFGRPVMRALECDALDAAAAAGFDAELLGELYAQLAEQVAVAPAAWEFALCLHRWTEEDPATDEAAIQAAGRADGSPVGQIELRDSDQLQVDPEHVAFFKGRDGIAWVDTRQQKAYRFPPWSGGMLSSLVGNERLSVRQLTERVPDEHADSAQRLLCEMYGRRLLVHRQSGASPS